MGQPAFITILRADAPTQTFTGRSGGYSIGTELIAFGIEGLIQDCRGWRWELEDGEGLEATWAHLGWAASFLAIDYRTSRILWDEHCLEIDSPRLVSRLFEQANPGWRAVWCPLGSDSLWRYLKDDPGASYLEPAKTDDYHQPHDDWFAQITDPSESFGADTLFTADLDDGTTASWRSARSVDAVTNASISALEHIANCMPGNTFEQHPVWPHRNDGYDEWPQGGVHFDFRQRRAWRWTNRGVAWDRFQPKLWPDWDFFELGDSWEIHLGRVAGRAIQPPLQDHLDDEEVPDDIPCTDHGSRITAAKLRELCTSGASLPATAFLQLDGTICWDPLEQFKRQLTR